MKRLLYLIPAPVLYVAFVEGGRIFAPVRDFLRRHDAPTGQGYFEWYPVVGLALWAMALALFWKERHHFGLKRPAKSDWQAGLAGFAALFLVAAVSRVLDPGYDAWYAGLAALTGWAAFGGFLASMPFQVAHEELFMRGLLQPLFSKALARFWTMMSLSLLFALAHYFFVPGSTYHLGTLLVFVFLGSWVLVAVFEKTHSLLISYLLHLAYNVVVLFQVYFHVENNLGGELLIFIPWGLLFAWKAKAIGKLLHFTLKDWKHGIRIGLLALLGSFVLWWAIRRYA